MKDQYFGDVHDFRKYGLLRQLCGPEKLTLGICWMLTKSDARRDGEFRAYLDGPDKFRECDGELFDWLKNEVKVESDRCIARIEQSSLLPNAVFHSRFLTDDEADRSNYFAECDKTMFGRDVVFFDPDNGLEVRIKKGRRDSKKYVYWDELQQAFRAGSSVLIYQHFRRKKRDEFITGVVEELRKKIEAPGVFTFRTPHVLFLLAAQERHMAGFRELSRSIDKRWLPIRARQSPQFVAQEYAIQT
jgi:hypothetical protein